jgi:hypothetical protein
MIGDVAGTVPTIVNADSADYADYAVKSVCVTLSSVSVILRPFCHPERSEGSALGRARSSTRYRRNPFASLGMTRFVNPPLDREICGIREIRVPICWNHEQRGSFSGALAKTELA